MFATMPSLEKKRMLLRMAMVEGDMNSEKGDLKKKGDSNNENDDLTSE